MKLRHVVLMKFPDGISPGELSQMHEAVLAMAAAIPDVLGHSSGVDVSGKEENYDYALVFDFADQAAYERYRVHAAHQAFIAGFMRGRRIDKVRIQLSLDETQE